MKKKAIEKTELEKRLEAEAAAEAAQEADASQAAEEAEDDGEDLPNIEVLPEVDVAALTSERDALKDQLLRTRADFDNFRKRIARDDARLRKTAAEGVVRDLLPVLDNLERALEHANDDSGGLASGVEMVRKQFSEVLARHGLSAIPSDGHTFDPNVHEAVACVPSEETPPNHVIQEFQRGYRLGDRVLRPAKVVVSAGPPESSEEEALRNAVDSIDNEQA
jgi:molecular chaperone GrpE